ncbi:hypothetical protein F4778DRAFT_756798 [Xylariomycetidae sp. FL2044]|nr:hypothetical protein F4778DRAFT_756798 [Xylariomycetidae sp. FL2044]
MIMNIPLLRPVAALALLALTRPWVRSTPTTDGAIQGIHEALLIRGVPNQLHERNDTAQVNGGLEITVYNNLPTELYVYLDGLRPTPNSAELTPVFFKDNQFTPVAGSSNLQNLYYLCSSHENITIQLNGYLNSSRVWFSEKPIVDFMPAADGKLVQPSVSNPSLPSWNTSFSFMEFNHGPGEFVANPSFVDWVGLSYQFTVSHGNGNPSKQIGIQPDTRNNMCNDLKDKTSSTNPTDPTMRFNWTDICMPNQDGSILRVLSPSQFISIPTNVNHSIGKLYDNYINSVWDKFEKNPLIFELQDASSVTRIQGNLQETFNDTTTWVHSQQAPGRQDWVVKNSTIGTFGRPTTPQVLQCAGGPFIVNDMVTTMVPPLCAGLIRSTMLLDNGNVQPNKNISSASYYMNDPINWYSRLVHQYANDGEAYAFPYDDVNGDQNENAAGVLTLSGADADDIVLAITVDK